jgi:nicotinamidase/pyrazinamidase
MKKSLNVHLLIIDPQNDFCDIPGATLPVTGAKADMGRLAKLIDRIGPKLADIHVTMDSHRIIDIAHPAWWVDSKGNPPAPFTLISAADIEAGIWTPRNIGFRARSLAYARSLESSADHYKICVWPPHCLIGTWGHNVQDTLNTALQTWSFREFAMVDYVTKGSNPFTEHYGALAAEVPDPSDSGTSLNTDFLQVLSQADIVVVGGEASSHCVLKTVSQIAQNIGVDQVAKFHLLTDCMSPVGALPGVDFPKIAVQFQRNMEKLGMHLTDSVSFLA